MNSSMENMSETLPVIPEVTASVATPETTPKSKLGAGLPKKKILLLIGAAAFLFALFTVNKKINAIQQRNFEITKMLKDAGKKHGPDGK